MEDTKSLNIHPPKCKVWDVVNKKWFKPTCPDFKNKETHELYFSQSGEIFIHSVVPDETGKMIESVKHAPNNIYIPCVYSGLKDQEGKKLYQNDVITNGDLVWLIQFVDGAFTAHHRPKLGEVNYEPFQNLSTILRITKIDLKGNILENPELI